VTIEADIVKQKQATNNGGYTAIGFGKTHPLVYDKLVPDNPIELTRWQVVNCYMGRAGLINSGGASGDNDLAQAVRTAVINKRAGGMGLISGRKSFQKPMKDGVTLLNAIQDVFLCEASLLLLRINFNCSDTPRDGLSFLPFHWCKAGRGSLDEFAPIR
jgi:class I fructose-bisphosphate aldolase